MTHRPDVARGRDIVARWCALAERRLEHLTELFESGRWRRYHTELAFLENIQEAKSAVEIWRDLLRCEASRDNSAVDVSWLGRARPTSARGQALRHQVHRLQPLAVEIADQRLLAVVSAPVEAERTYSDHAASAPPMDGVPDLMPDIDAIEQRYPLLRNAL
jgi:uncharacterized repeat protein (TIGR03809 family)